MTDSPPTPKWALPSTRRFKRSQKQERRVGEALGGRALPRSGGVKAAKGPDSPTLDGDFRTPTLHGEHKRTETQEIRVESEWFVKVTAGAARCHKVPVVVLLLESVVGDDREWIFLPLSYAQARMGELLRDPSAWEGAELAPRPGCRSFLFRASVASALHALAGDKLPLFLLTWGMNLGATAQVWVGAPLARLTPMLREP